MELKLRHLTVTATSVAVVIVCVTCGAGCLDRNPIPARRAASAFGVIGDIELIAHQEGAQMGDGENGNEGAKVHAPGRQAPGAEAAPPAWGAASSAGSDRKATSRGAVPDSRLRLLVERSLHDAGVDREGVMLEIERGRVTLKGRVESKMARDRLEVTVRSVDAVKEVVNRIEIVEE